MDQREQKLWDMLGDAPRPVAPAFFAARVMRRIESLERVKTTWLAPIFQWLAPAAVAALFLAAVLFKPNEQDTAPLSAGTEISALDIVQIISPEDYVVLTSVDWPYESTLSAGM